MRLIGSILASALALAALPASACDTGPWPVDFLPGRVMPTKDGEAMLNAAAVTQRINGPSHRVRIIVYNPGATSPALLRKRIGAARFYLNRDLVEDSHIEVVPIQTRGGMIGDRWIGRATRMEVELNRGCGG